MKPEIKDLSQIETLFLYFSLNCRRSTIAVKCYGTVIDYDGESYTEVSRNCFESADGRRIEVDLHMYDAHNIIDGLNEPMYGSGRIKSSNRSKIIPFIITDYKFKKNNTSISGILADLDLDQFVGQFEEAGITTVEHLKLVYKYDKVGLGVLINNLYDRARLFQHLETEYPH